MDPVKISARDIRGTGNFAHFRPKIAHFAKKLSGNVRFIILFQLQLGRKKNTIEYIFNSTMIPRL